MDNEIIISIIKLISLEKEILNNYRIIIKKQIQDEDINNEINNIKILAKEEEFLYKLTYEKLNNILKFIENSKELEFIVMQRITNLLNIIIDKKYLKEKLEEKEEYIDEESLEYLKKEDLLVEYLERDLILLKIKKITEKINLIKTSKIKNNLINYKYLFIYSNISIEKELLNNNMNIDNIYLINILASQLCNLEKEDIIDIYKEILDYELNIESIQNILNINNIIKQEGINEENKNFLETEIIINIAFLEAKLEIFSLNKEEIIKKIKNKIKNNEYLLNKIINNLFNEEKNKTSYLTLIRKK